MMSLINIKHSDVATEIDP